MTPEDRERIITRRQMLVAGGALGIGAGAVLLGCGSDKPPTAATTAGRARTAASAAAPASCVLSPEQTEGPYYLAGAALRRDITEGKPGAPLELRLTVQRVSSCEPIRNATVEVWHADALGNYSSFSDAGSRTFLRGGQRTGADGVAVIDTIYPGWYQGRTTHIHVKVHTGGSDVHTGQLYFDQAVTDAVYRGVPYSQRGPAETTNSADQIYASGGRELTLQVSRGRAGRVGRLTLGVRV